MCGFLGFSSKGDIDDSFSKPFKAALTTLRHRGPDGGGMYSDLNVFLGHNRLSIIDLSTAADQPFWSSNRQAIIVFNGEIYNYKELSEGLSLKTQSDTEVLVEGFLRYGVDFFKSLRGIYSFAILLKDQKKLILYRDLAGVKPLYFTHDPERGELIFGSELKAILPLMRNVAFDEEVLKTYIHLGYCLEPSTIYKEVFALKPGSLLTFDINSGSIETQTISSFDFQNSNTADFSTNVERTRELLSQACKRNLVADVDISVALSSGIDSSLVLALSRESSEVKALTVKFDELSYDETRIAKLYADHVKASHRVISTNAESKLDLLDKLLLHFDQPYADSSLIPFYFLNKESAKYSKVLIGGDSGDEIHNGYIGFSYLPTLLRISRSRLLPLYKSALKILLKLMPGSKRKRELRKILNLVGIRDKTRLLFEWNCWFPTALESYQFSPFKYDPSKISEDFLLKNNLEDTSSITETYFTKRMQSDYLRKADMMSMYSSVEFRVPMLDEDLVSYSLSIPYKQKSNLISQKNILRKIHSKIFPPYTSSLKKKGFSIPLDTWLGGTNLQTIKHYILREDGLVVKFIMEKYIELLFITLDKSNPASLQQEEYCSRASAYQRVLILYSLQLWYFQTFLVIRNK